MQHKSITLFDFGYQFLGPICSEYFWSLKNLIIDKPDSPIMFLAREGYFLQKIYQNLQSNNLLPSSKSIYLLASRTFLFRITISDPYSWEFSCKHNFEGTFDQFLCARFGFTHADNTTIFSEDILEQSLSLPQDFDKLTTLFYKYIDELDDAVRDSRANYKDYLASLGLYSDNEPVLVDVGYSGTIQKLLTRLIGKNTTGLYFITTKSGKYNIANNLATMQPVFKDNVKMGDGYHMLDKSLFLEALLTSPNGQFIDIHKLQNPLQKQESFLPVYGRVSYTQANFEELQSFFNGAIEAVKHNFEHKVRFSVDEIERLYRLYTTQPNMIPNLVRPLFDVDDAISGNSNVNPLQLFGV